MSDIQIGLLSIAGILILIYSGMHVAIALTLLSFLGVGLIRDNWTIRMKHTQLDEYTTPLWESQDWVTIYQSNERPGETGWQYYNFTTPFDYNGTDNLMVDFSLDKDYWDAVRGHVYTTPADSNRTVGYKTDDDVAPPTQW